MLMEHTDDYLKKNDNFWTSPYEAPNVESWIFRLYGRILKYDYGITGSANERLLDFGCGQGGALKYFNKLGFDCSGVDISNNDITAAQNHMPELYDQLQVIDPKPHRENMYFGGNFDIVISIQTLDWLSDADCDEAIECLYRNMKTGGKIYASYNAWDHFYRDHAEEVGDGLWRVKLKLKGPLANKRMDNRPRQEYDFFNNFAKSKEHLARKFHIFKPIYLDEYNASFREEGSEHRYTFFGIKA